MRTARISVWANEAWLAWSEWAENKREPKRRPPEIRMPVKPGTPDRWELSGFT